MFDRLLNEMREAVRDGRYGLSIHARKEMRNDGLDDADVIECILGGRIVERQQDRLTSEFEYRIRGAGLFVGSLEIVAKWNSDRDVVIITAYAL